MPEFFIVTPQAAEQIKSAAQQSEAAEGPTLRIAARSLPDGGIDYGMGFDEQREFDLEIVSHGINILIGPSSRDLLEGVTLDFVELEPGRLHFIFIPPQVKPDEARQDGAGKGAA
ncbi:MAG: iron-sulfur cluster assembly accessory protein [Hydrogenophilales bacterium]|nr:iron-sulfur cluster assembly accessory protein [Hydrogenophilales bacterium]